MVKARKGGHPMSEPLQSDQNEHYDHDEKERDGAILDAPLRDVPTRQLLTVGPDETAATVIASMNAAKTGCALVMDGKTLVGIFTERDVLQKVATSKADGTKVRALMTANPDTLPSSATVAYALNRMSVEGYRHLPIVDDEGTPVAVVGMRDVINWMVDLYPSQVQNVHPAPSSFPKTREGG
jgi:CBS domain-containing protein